MATNEFQDFDKLRVRLASTEEMLDKSHGEVKLPETINYRTFKPEKNGLFDERIFGPTHDFQCYCGKYKGVRFRGVVCDKCGVEVTHSRVRRERMGHIKLASPVVHPWFFRGVSSKLGLLLNIPSKSLTGVIYFASYLVIDVDDKKREKVLDSLKEELEKEKEKLEKEVEEKIEKKKENVEAGAESKKDAEGGDREFAGEEKKLRLRKEIAALESGLEMEVKALQEKYAAVRRRIKKVEESSVMSDAVYSEYKDKIDQFAEVGIGAEAIKRVLEEMHLKKEAARLREEMEEMSKTKKRRASKRLRLLRMLIEAEVKAPWMVLEVIPVIPPELRPLVQLEGGRFASSDLNDLYRRVINRNNRLAKLNELGAPEVIVRNEKRMLQEAVDSLIDKSRTGNRQRRGRRELKSLSDMLRGKKGRFRQNLLGKRVDYSGRSVIVVGPDLKLNEVGLPKEMALELFKPFVLKEIYERGLAPNIKAAKYFLEERSAEVWDILEEKTKDYGVMLNRAPTLHRLSIQSFYPKLIDGNAIQLHPCACAGFNADFDGDAMSVHVPLSQASRAEVEEDMLSIYNLLKPADGRIVANPSKDMLLGVYYFTSLAHNNKAGEKIYADELEALLAQEKGLVSWRQPAKVRIDGEVLETSCGRILFNQELPEDYSYQNKAFDKSGVKDLLEDIYENYGREETVRLIDALKRFGFTYATASGASVGLEDLEPPQKREEVLEKANKRSQEIQRNLKLGLVTKQESKRLSEGVWLETMNNLGEIVWNELEPGSPARIIIDAGAARATKDQMNQISGMKGLVADPTGEIVDLPIRSNYHDGLSGFEYFASARGARKSLVDIALKTADAGYLTRRLVDVAQDVLVREEDCGTKDGIEVHRDEETMLSGFSERLVGRIAAKSIGKIVKRNELITEEKAEKISADKSIESVMLRSPLTCETLHGVCSQCYGIDMGENAMVEVGTPVGVIAAQSVGEPGTQLTLWAKHAGGIVREKEVTQGLPRVEELFEARTPKSKSIISELEGEAEVVQKDGKDYVQVKATKGDEVVVDDYALSDDDELIVESGDKVKKGQALTRGHKDPEILMEILGLEATQKYIREEVQQVYSSQGIKLDDKHVEVLIRQMFSKVKIDDPGDANFILGDLVTRDSFVKENSKVIEQGDDPAEGHRVILGITRSALLTDSFLSAASFQSTTRVLTDAALSGAVDPLLGLKENVIIGRVIPVGERARLDKEEDVEDEKIEKIEKELVAEKGEAEK